MDTKYHTVSGGEVELKIQRLNNNSLHIKVLNLLFEQEKRSHFKHLFTISVILILSLYLLKGSFPIIIFLEIGVVTFKLISLACLVHSGGFDSANPFFVY